MAESATADSGPTHPDADEVALARIVDVAAGLFGERGYKATPLRLVAHRARLSTKTVRRLVGDRAGLFRLVMSAKVPAASVAEQVAAAVVHPSAAPPLSVILAAVRELYLDPAASWDVLELEALVQSRRDPELAELETRRMASRFDNLAALGRQLREAGGVDADLDDAALTHCAMALSVGLAMLHPVVDDRPDIADWDALLARLGAAVAPTDLASEAGFYAGAPWRVRVDVRDRPGELPKLARALGTLQAYTLAFYVVGARNGYRTFDLALIAPPSVAAEQIEAAARSIGREAYVSPGDPDDALDLPTRVIDAATQLVATPGWTPIGARMLAEADSVEVVPATEGAESEPYVLRLQWTPTRHVVLRRSWAPFARAERTRASALLRLSAAVATLAGDDDRLGWVEHLEEVTVTIRLAQPADADAVSAMHARSSDDSRYKRYASLAQWQELQIRRLTGGHRGASLVAVNEVGNVIALGNVVPESEESHAAEIALLVEDAYQGKGVGQSLLRHLIELAHDLGFTEVVAVALADNAAILHLLEKTELPWTRQISAGFTFWRAPLDR